MRPGDSGKVLSFLHHMLFAIAGRPGPRLGRAERCEFLGERVEDDLLVLLARGVHGANLSFERLQLLSGRAATGAPQLLKLRLELLDVLLRLLLVELQRLYIRAQTVEFLFQNGQLLRDGLLAADARSEGQNCHDQDNKSD